MTMAEATENSRLEAFCDGVFAIAITLLVIDVKIPHGVEINDSAALWSALAHITPAIFAFLLSFVVILITWVNHHNHMKLVKRCSSSTLYAHGFLLLTVAFTPFPTSLLGEHLFTDHAAPAVVLYDSILALQAVGWILITRTALQGQLGKSDKATVQIRNNGTFGAFAFALYGLCAVLAFWFPIAIAMFTCLTWVFWLVYGISIRHTEA